MDMAKKRAWVMALVMKCPFEEPLPECPAYALRGRPLKEQMEAVDAMELEVIDRILDLHKQCLDMREASL